MDGWMGGLDWIRGIDRQIHIQIDTYIDRYIDRQIDGWVDELRERERERDYSVSETSFYKPLFNASFKLKNNINRGK